MLPHVLPSPALKASGAGVLLDIGFVDLAQDCELELMSKFKNDKM